MKTCVEPATLQAVQQAAQLLRQGQVVAIPTETVYGLAADATCDAAVARIFEAKGRPQDNPLIVHVADMPMLKDLVGAVGDKARRLAKAFWPGPLTLIFPGSGKAAKSVSAGLGTVAVRMPSHPVALEVIRQAGVPLAAPSANLSGSPSPTTAEHVWQDLQGKIPLILDGGSSSIGVESTVLSLVEKPLLLRPGYITPQQLEKVLGQPVQISPAVQAPLKKGEAPQSPGMKYKHYAPKAEITLVQGSFEGFKGLLKRNMRPDVWALCFAGEGKDLPAPSIEYGAQNDAPRQAAELFAALRALDEAGAQTVYARCPQNSGVGLAVYNRLLRAAAFRVVEV